MDYEELEHHLVLLLVNKIDSDSCTLNDFCMFPEFLFKVYPVPETLSSLIPVFIASDLDFKLLQDVAESQQGRNYQWGLYSLHFYQAVRYPWLHPAVTLIHIVEYLLKLKVFSQSKGSVFPYYMSRHLCGILNHFHLGF